MGEWARGGVGGQGGAELKVEGRGLTPVKIVAVVLGRDGYHGDRREQIVHLAWPRTTRIAVKKKGKRNKTKTDLITEVDS